MEIAAFALPAAPLLALTLPTVMFLPPHFNEHLGLPLWVVSAIFFGARVFDLALDPLIGSWQDRTESPWGRRRIWLAISTPFLMALMWVVFIALGPGASVLSASAAIFVMYFVFAIMMVAHLGWSGELVPTYHGRTRTLGAVQAASLVGQAIMLVLAGYIVQVAGGSDADAVAAMGWTLIIMLPRRLSPSPCSARVNVRFRRSRTWACVKRSALCSPTKSHAACCCRIFCSASRKAFRAGSSSSTSSIVLGFERESQTLARDLFSRRPRRRADLVVGGATLRQAQGAAPTRSSTPRRRRRCCLCMPLRQFRRRRLLHGACWSRARRRRAADALADGRCRR